jgi:hypothetical protein
MMTFFDAAGGFDDLGAPRRNHPAQSDLVCEAASGGTGRAT